MLKGHKSVLAGINLKGLFKSKFIGTFDSVI